MSSGASVGQILLEKEILLESGTNELEVLVFTVGGCTFGINVAKVREVLPKQTITQLPKAHKSVRGVFKLRDRVIPIVSLVDHLQLERIGEDSESRMILTDFNQQQTAFLVDQVERIHRLSWKQIQQVPCSETMQNTPLTAVAKIQERMILMLDFEMVIDQVTDHNMRSKRVENKNNLPRETLRLVLADDSPTVRQAVSETMRNSGYTNLKIFENGKLAWEYLSGELKLQPGVAPCDLIISDVEMPQMDGLHFTKRVKETPELKHIPVLLYSSIVTPDNFKKGEAVGADAQISKPDLCKVVQIADDLILRAQQNGKSSTTTAQAPASTSGITNAVSPAAPAEISATTPVASAPVVTPVAQQSQAAPTATLQSKSVQSNPKPAVASQTAPVTATSKKQVESEPGMPRYQPPRGVDSNLWQTFHTELEGRVDELQRLLDVVNNNQLTADQLKAIERTLHTVKSSSMVVPVPAISETTHALETLFQPARESLQQCPRQAFNVYVEWLGSVVGGGNVETALSAAPRLG